MKNIFHFSGQLFCLTKKYELGCINNTDDNIIQFLGFCGKGSLEILASIPPSFLHILPLIGTSVYQVI